MNVLIVDDSKTTRMILMRSLKQAGFENMQFTAAENGSEALEKVQTIKPSLILCDWNMPVMNGLELLKTLRANDNQVPFGFVTTESTAEMRAVAREAGAQFLLPKPFTPEMLKGKLEPLILAINGDSAKRANG